MVVSVAAVIFVVVVVVVVFSSPELAVSLIQRSPGTRNRLFSWRSII